MTAPTPYYDKDGITIYCGDCRDVLPMLGCSSVDAIVTDPPYGLSFMGKGWDHGVPGILFWTEALRVAKPGAHLLAFGGTRTHHRLMVAFEDAGWEIRDCLMWVYGSGFPKSLNVSKAIDKAAGAEREVISEIVRGDVQKAKTSGVTIAAAKANKNNEKIFGYGVEKITAPATEAAKQWDGWGTALKPAWEPIILARKPLDGTVAANVQQHGTGALNVDGCRVNAKGDNLGGGAEKETQSDKPEGWDRPWRSNKDAQAAHAKRIRENVQKAETLGRFPANLIHDGSDEVLAGFPDTGKSTGGNSGTRGNEVYGKYGESQMGVDPGFGDSGSAARFFYTAKASKSDRGHGNNHPTVKPTDLMRYLVRLVCPIGGTVLDLFNGSGATTYAARKEHCRTIGIEQEASYCEIAVNRLKQGVLNFTE